MSLVGNKLGGKERDAYDFMRFESNSTLKMYEKESMPEAGKSCLRQINLASSPVE